jgi:hypothetical protein
MKKRLTIINTFLIVAVLFSMLFQSIHSYEHFEKQLSEKKCYHKLNLSSQITHQHHGFDHCFVCEFTLSNFTTLKINSFEFKNYNTHFNYSFLYSKKISQYFKGSLFQLRAPPYFIV